MSEFPDKVIVTGVITPAAAVGIYDRIADYGGLPAYKHATEDWYIWQIDSGVDGYIDINLSIAVGDVEHAMWYLSGQGAGQVDGQYAPLYGATGTARAAVYTDHYVIYGGQDGAIDYETPLGIMGLGDDEQMAVQGLNLQPNTIWHFVRRRVRGDGCGLEGPSSDPCIIRIEADGTMRLAAPNRPYGLSAEALAGGKIRAQWYYSSEKEEASPVSFRVYLDGVLADTVEAGMYPWSYTWDSDALTHGQRYRVTVRSLAAGGGESIDSLAVTVLADTAGPPAITGLAGTWVEE